MLARVTPEELSAALVAVLTAAHDAGEVAAPAPTDVRVERPRSKEHGDWSTNVALQLAKPAGVPPRQLADVVATRLRDVAGVAAVDVAGPGFLNITLDAASAGELARTVVEAGEAYGRSDRLAGRVINLEFVSANPTGPLHIGHTRWAALGDALHRLFAASGAQVTAEHYSNNQGGQMDLLGASLLASLRGAPAPEGGYSGEYVDALAREVHEANPGLLDLPDAEALTLARREGEVRQVRHNQETLARFHVDFDVWFDESDLHERGSVASAVERLREQGHVFDEDGAVWLRTTDFGDDRNRVLIRADGRPTYFAADAAYYLDKKDRGFTEKIYLLGADHHGYINRLKSISACAGDDPAVNIEILIGQLITIGGERMGKRRGNALFLDDLLDWIGTDPIRYSLARFPADTPLDLDGEQMKRRTNDNPVFYVQYAHARTCGVARLAGEDGVDRADGFDPALLSHETEAALLALIGDFPRIVFQAADLREPHRVARYLEDLAAGFHKWYDECRVRPFEDEEVTDLHRTRLWLNDATRVVLANGLGLLGVSAPERL